MYPLKRVREAAGLSQSQLARKAGVPLRQLQAFEVESQAIHRSINRAAAARVWRLAQALGCTVGDILEPEDDV